MCCAVLCADEVELLARVAVRKFDADGEVVEEVHARGELIIKVRWACPRVCGCVADLSVCVRIALCCGAV